MGHLAIAVLKPLSIIIPLHLGLFAAVWVVGVCRLRRDTGRTKVMRSLRILALILAVILFVVAFSSILLPSNFTIFQPLLSLLTFPLNTAFLDGVWGLGLAVSIGLMTISLTLLWQISDNLNLSRAAQETHHFHTQRVAFRIGDFDRINEMKDRERLGSMHVPSKIPVQRCLDGDMERGRPVTTHIDNLASLVLASHPLSNDILDHCRGIAQGSCFSFYFDSLLGAACGPANEHKV